MAPDTEHPSSAYEHTSVFKAWRAARARPKAALTPLVRGMAGEVARDEDFFSILLRAVR
jgi:hypothetical protein